MRVLRIGACYSYVQILWRGAGSLRHRYFCQDQPAKFNTIPIRNDTLSTDPLSGTRNTAKKNSWEVSMRSKFIEAGETPSSVQELRMNSSMNPFWWGPLRIFAPIYFNSLIEDPLPVKCPTCEEFVERQKLESHHLATAIQTFQSVDGARNTLSCQQKSAWPDRDRFNYSVGMGW